MIRVNRGPADQLGAEGLGAIEATALAAMRARAESGDAIDGPAIESAGNYRVAGELLWRRQHRKCAYCENVEQKRRNDVEHFRPKARADRRPGSTEDYGYWWLAWRWDNLLFACRNCNQSLAGGRGKVDRFPLAPGSAILVPEQDPYGKDASVESAWLVNPAGESGVAHIEFVPVCVGSSTQWRPRARSGSVRGDRTIAVCALDRDDLIELYGDHVNREVKPRADRFLERHPHSDARAIWQQVQFELYRPGMAFVGLSYDALRVFVTDDELAEHRLTRDLPQ